MITQPAHNIAPAMRANTFTLAQIRDVDALVTAVATTAAAVTYSGATLTGVLANPGPAILRAPQFVTVTTDVSAGAYTLTAITITGTLNGVAQTAVLTLTQVNGGETLATTVPFDVVTSIARLAMVDASGQLEFGVRDLVFDKGLPCRQVRHGSAGLVEVKYFNGSSAAFYESLPGLQGEKHIAVLEQVIADGTSTSDPITVYWGA